MVFGEMEFWAALIKVLALVTFLVVGTVFLAGRFKIDGHDTGPGMWRNNGGLLPAGLLPLVSSLRAWCSHTPPSN